MNVNKDVLEIKRNEFRRPRPPVLSWWNKRRNDQLNRDNSVRERSISILQKRYGFNREGAIYQLDNYYSNARLG